MENIVSNQEIVGLLRSYGKDFQQQYRISLRVAQKVLTYFAPSLCHTAHEKGMQYGISVYKNQQNNLQQENARLKQKVKELLNSKLNDAHIQEAKNQKKSEVRLSKSRRKIYDFLVDTGKIHTNAISRETGIPIATTHQALKFLSGKGLIHCENQGNKVLWVCN